MKIELKRFTSNERLSQETLAYAADVYVDGKKVGTSENNGHGGADNVRFIDREAEKKVINFVAALPPIVTEMKDAADPTQPFTYEQTLSSFFADLANSAHAKRTTARTAKRHAKFAAQAKARGFKAFIARLGTKSYHDEVLFEAKDLGAAQKKVSDLEVKYKKSCFYMDEVKP